MAKRRHDEAPSSSRGTLTVLAIGGLVVAGLVGWALTRTIETPLPAPPTNAARLMASPPAPQPPASDDLGPTAATTTTATATAPIRVSESSTPRSEVEGDTASVRRIAVEDLHEEIGSGEVTVIDVRDERSFEAGHIPGALHYPLASIETQIDLIPKGKPIVTYCT
jgi:Rhodanese-like domain